jgi:hypothetical protein
MITQVNEQFCLGTHAERLPLDPSKFPEGYVFYETDTHVSVIQHAGSWQPLASGALANAAIGHATIPAGQDHVDVAIAGLTSAADPIVGIKGTAFDLTLVRVLADPQSGFLRILGNAPATANVTVVYLVENVL